MIDEQLEQTYSTRVYLEDTDAFGVLYHAAYVRYFERGRTEWLNRLGITVNSLLEKGFKFLIAHIDVEFKKPAFLEDNLKIRTKLASVRHCLAVFHQDILNEEGVKLCTAKVKVVSVDKSNSPCAMNDMIPLLKEGA